MSIYNFVHYTSQIYSVLVHLINISGSHGDETKIKISRPVMPLTLKNNAWRIDLKPWNKSGDYFTSNLAFGKNFFHFC
jgi:hypothetical protein